MAVFGLVHGACHGPWCWTLLVPELERLGHDAILVDLPAEDPAAGIAANAACVARAVSGRPDLILVGHSAAGTFLPLAAESTSAGALVFLAAMVPVPGMSCREQARRDPTMLTFPHDRVHLDDLGRQITPPDVAREAYYHDCPAPLAEWAVTRLRPQSPRAMDEPYPAACLPDLPWASIVCTDDRCVSPAWSRRVSKERLGRPAIELASGHSPFLSRPRELAGVLTEIAAGLL